MSLAWDYTKLAFLGAVTYLLVGSVIVLVRAYVSALRGEHWFTETGRASSTENRWYRNNELGSPVWVLIGWPIALVVGTILFVASGWRQVVEYLGDKVVEAGTKREKQLRGIKSNERSGTVQ